MFKFIYMDTKVENNFCYYNKVKIISNEIILKHSLFHQIY